MYKYFIKPLFDFITSLLLLIVFSPFIIGIIIFLFFVNHKKVFFYQQRPGLKGKPFKIVKFKTMRDAYDINGMALPDEQRMTKIGNFLRSYSLDELLQLVNVVKGDMSIVGPRPLMMQYLSRYNAEQAKRHSVKPGITGWAQINGRNAINWDQRFKYDVEYVNKQSFLFDIKILWFTFINVIKRKDITPGDKPVMDEFMGHN